MRHSNSLRLAIAALCLILIFASGALAAEGTRTKKNISFAAAAPGGTFYPLAGGMATYFNTVLPGYNVTVETTGGSIENIRVLQAGKAYLGLNNASEAYWAYKGLEVFAGHPAANIRIISYVFQAISQWVTLESSGIKTLEDMRGKRIGIGPPGSGAALMAETLLRHLGLFDKVRVNRLPPDDGIRALKDGQIDVYNYAGHVPTSFVLEVGATHKFRLIDTTKEIAESKFSEKYPYFPMAVIPAGTYKGIDTDIGAVGSPVVWTTHAGVPDDVVYDLVKTLFSQEGLAHMSTVHSVTKGLSTKNGAMDIGVPFHPGAARFWREINALPAK